MRDAASGFTTRRGRPMRAARHSTEHYCGAELSADRRRLGRWCCRGDAAVMLEVVDDGRPPI